MDLDKLLPNNSPFLAKSDFGPEGKTVTIKEFKRVKVKSSKGDEDKLAIFFDEFEKGMILNKTNKNRIVSIFKTSETGELVGRKVNVFEDEDVEYGGEIRGGLRIRRAKEDAARAERREDEVESLDELDDDIPF